MREIIKSRKSKRAESPCLEINAGIACPDRANEVEPRPNKKNALIVRDCHVAEPAPSVAWGLLAMTVKGFGCHFAEPVPNEVWGRAMTVILIILKILIKSWFRLLDCFAEPVPNKVWGLAMTALFRHFRAFISFALFFILLGASIQAQQITPLSNPSQVVVMGDALTFQVNILSPAAYPDGQLEVTVPAGFKLLPTNIIPSTLASNGLSGRIAANVQASTTLPLTFYVQPLCNAVSGQTIAYGFYTTSSATSPTTTATTDPVANFYDPILNVTYPAVINNAILNQAYTRVLSITQTASSSHVNNLQVTVDCSDKTAFEITKIEVSHDSSLWTDITASALDIAQANKYVYKITRTNTFAPLLYVGQQLGVGDVVYIRETVKVKKCGGGITDYSIAYGDGNTFCSAVSTAQVNINALNPAYSVDYERTTSYISNINYGQAASFNTKISNKSTNSEAWMLKTFVSIYDNKYNSRPPHRFDSAALMNTAGNTVICKIPLINNIAMQSTSFTNTSSSFNRDPHLHMYKIDLNQLPQATTQTLIDAYTNAGLADIDGDGIYSDILPGKTVTIKIYYHFYIENGIVNCSTNRLFECYIRSDVFWEDRCEKKWSYSRASAASSSTYFEVIEGGMNSPVASIDNSLLAAGDKATLTVMMQDANASSGQGGYPYQNMTTTRIHKVEITMSDGLDYDINDNVIKIRNQTNVTTVNATEVTWDAATRKLIFRNTKSLAQPIYYEIPVVANLTTDISKSFRIEHTFEEAGMGTGPHRWSCWNATVPYIQQLPCNSLEMVEFTAERTSFGWEDPSQTNRLDTTVAVRANRNTPGIDLQAVGPYDNITFVNNIFVNSNVSSLSTGDSVIVELTYSVPYAGALFDMPTTDASRKIVLSYKSGTSPWSQVAIFSSSSNSSLIRKTNTNPNHTLGINIASFIGSGKAIPALGAGDSLRVEYFLQTTANIPIGYPALVSVQAEVYIKKGSVKEVCYPRLQTIKTFNYRIDQIISPSGDYANVNITHNGVFLRWQLGNGTGNVAEVFPNEYRPNAFYKDMTLSIDALVEINNLYWSKQSGTDYPMTKGADYTVTYRNDSTIITMLTYPLMQEAFIDYYKGWYVHGSYDIICINPSRRSIISYSRFQQLDYPTSATTETYNQRTGYTCTYGCNNLTLPKHYQTSVTTPQALKNPLTSEVSWDFNINNASTFANTDSKLPNSWIAFECDAGIIPFELYDKQEGITITITDIEHKYAANKWWVKLGDLSISTSRTYTIRCTYTACSGQPGMNIIHGFARLVYPEDPQKGFTAYNFPICSPKSVRVEMTPPTVNFSGALTHQPKNINGTNDFCDVVSFQAKFRNGLSSEISNLKLRVPLPSGFTYDASQPAQVRFGTGAAVAAADVQISSGYLTITLSNTNQILTAFGTAGDSAHVDFRLNISCGAENKQQIYADFIGESGCGAQIKKTYNSGQIEIAGMATMPIYWVTVSSAQPTPVYTSAISPNDGSFTISGIYRRTQLPGGDSCQAIIELPANLNLTSQRGSDFTFVQNDTRLTATLPSTDAQNSVRTFDLTLTPVNPALWNEDSVKINFYTGVETEMSCNSKNCSVLDKSEALDSIKFAMKMLEIRYSDSIVAHSRFASSTTEHVEITGWLVNKETSAAFNAGQLTMELLYRSGGSYVPITATVSGLTVSSVTNNNNTQFKVIADIPNTENICEMLLVLYKTGSGTSNAYLANADSIIVPSPRYEIKTQPSEICQMAVNTSIGENSIAGYTYSWSPSDYLNNANTTPTNFTYGYQSKPVANDTTLVYLVSITRPNSCVSTDTIFVPLKGIPSVDVKDTAVCHNTSLNITFTDATNNTPATPTSFSWTIANGSSVGLPANGSGNIVATVTNPTSSSVTATVTVTPRKNGCDGVSRMFTITVYSPLNAGSISATKTYCYGGILPAIFLGSNSSTGGSGNYTYRWEDSTKQTTWKSISVSYQTYNINGDLDQTTYYRRAVIDICGTAYSDTITVHPVPKVSGLTDICPGLTTHLTPNTNGFWESSDSSIVDIVKNGTIVGVKPGNADLTFYDSSAGGCSSPLTITVNDYLNPDEITGSAKVCIGETIELSNTTPNGAWSKNNDNISLSNDVSNPAKVTVRGEKEGKSFVTYTVSNVGCKTKRTFRVKVKPNTPPKIIIGIER